MKKGIRTVILLVSLAANAYLIFIITNNPDVGTPKGQALPSDYPYLSKRLFAQEVNDILINFTDLRKELKEYVKKNEIEDYFALYFEYLPSGVSASINEDRSCIEASLIKLPAVMALYREIGNDKKRFDDVLVLQEADIDSGYGNLWTKGPNTQITVREAVNLVLTESDNTAYRALLRYTNDSIRKAAFEYLDIPELRDAEFPVVSAKNYSSVLRSLYLSSYLQKNDSNEILDILTRNVDNGGLAAGVLPGIKVAHKTSYFELNDKRVFNDCGIVFVPSRPYMLCMMAKNMPHELSQRYMHEVSALVFEYVSRAQVNPD